MPRKKLNREQDCIFKASWPSYYLEEKGYTVHEGRAWCPDGKAVRWPLRWESSHNANEVWELYQDRKADIDSWIGGQHEKFPETPLELLHLASDVSGYSNVMDTGQGDIL
jgi:hypothetical protein